MWKFDAACMYSVSDSRPSLAQSLHIPPFTYFVDKVCPGRPPCWWCHCITPAFPMDWSQSLLQLGMRIAPHMPPASRIIVIQTCEQLVGVTPLSQAPGMHFFVQWLFPMWQLELHKFCSPWALLLQKPFVAPCYGELPEPLLQALRSPLHVCTSAFLRRAPHPPHVSQLVVFPRLDSLK